MKKLIKLHKQWLKKGVLYDSGLCFSIPEEYQNTLNLFFPTIKDIQDMEKNKISSMYWGSGLHYYNDDIRKSYTPLRQTIVLLICAMHDEI